MNLSFLCLALMYFRSAAQEKMSDEVASGELLKTLNDLFGVALECTSEKASNGTIHPVTPCHAKTIDLLESRFKAMSDTLKPKRQTASDQIFSVPFANPTLNVTRPVNMTFESEIIKSSPGVKATTEGFLQRPNPHTGCHPKDFDNFTSGNVAIIRRGDCTFCSKVNNAMLAGAVGVIVDFLQGQNTFSMALEDCIWDPFLFTDARNHVPALTIDNETSETIRSYSDNLADISVSFSTNRDEVQADAINLILDLPGGDPNNVIVLGGHADTGQFSPGSNHNGGGIALMVEMARTLVKVFGPKGEGLKNSMRLCFWGSFAGGVDHYMTSLDDAEAKKVLMYLDMHGVAAPNGLNVVKDGTLDPNSPEESGYITEQFKAAFSGRDQPIELRELFKSAEYARFMNKGIPIGGLGSRGWGLKTEEQAKLFGGEAGVGFDPCFDEPCDTPDNIGLDRLTLVSQVAAQVSQQFLLDEDLPVRFGKKEKKPEEEEPESGPGILQWALLGGGVVACIGLILIVVFVIRSQAQSEDAGVELQATS